MANHRRVAGHKFALCLSGHRPEWRAYSPARETVFRAAAASLSLDNSINNVGRVEAGLTRAVEFAAVQEM